jgi:CheY-like chemotaxis protein
MRRRVGVWGDAPVKKMVLVVEDEADVRLLFMTVLADAGFEVVGAADGRRALDECARQDPDVIVLDLRMPVMDGATFVVAYRTLPTAGARIVAASALSEVETVAAPLGCDAVLRKPVDIDELVATVVALAAIPRPPVSRS